MKKIYVAWTYLDTIEVPDNASYEDIMDILDVSEPERGTWNDREWDYADERFV